MSDFMMLNNTKDYGLLTISEQQFNDSNRLSKKLLHNIKLAIHPDNMKNLHTAIKTNLIENGKKTLSATNIATKTIKNVIKILRKNEVSKDISKQARKQAKQIAKETTKTLIQNGKTAKSAEAIAKKELKDMTKQIKKELRKDVGKSSLNSKSISRIASKQAETIKKQIKQTLGDKKDASKIASIKAKEQKQEIKKVMRINNGKQPETVDKQTIIKEVIKKTLIKSDVPPKIVMQIVNKNINTTVDKTSKSISRIASKESKIVKKEMQNIVKKLNIDPIIATKIVNNNTDSAKKEIKQNLRIITNKPIKDSKSISNTVDNKLKDVVKDIEKKLKKEGISPATIEKKIVEKLNLLKKDAKNNLENKEFIVKSSDSLNRSASTKADELIKSFNKQIELNDEKNIKKSMKNIAHIIHLNKYIMSTTIKPANYHVNIHNVTTIIKKIKPSRIAKRLSHLELRTNDGKVIDKEYREKLLILILTAVKDLSLQILTLKGESNDKVNMDFFNRLMVFIKNENEIMKLTNKVINDNKFDKLVGFDTIETFRGGKSASKVSKKGKKKFNKLKKKSKRKSKKKSKKSKKKSKKAKKKSKKKSKKGKKPKGSSNKRKFMNIEDFSNIVHGGEDNVQNDTTKRTLMKIIQRNLLETFKETDTVECSDNNLTIVHYIIIVILIYFVLQWFKII